MIDLESGMAFEARKAMLSSVLCYGVEGQTRREQDNPELE